MSPRAVIPLVCAIAFFAWIVPSHAFGDIMNFQHCATNSNNKCMIPIPELNQGNGTANPNELITAIFPQNGAPIIQGVLSHDNFSKFETAPGIARVTFSTTTIPVTLNLCPLDKAELQNQDGYLSYFYTWNATEHKNMTHLIYPDFCYPETGPNPVDGSYVKPVSTPEFPNAAIIIGFVLIFASMIVLAKHKSLGLK